MYYIIKKIEEKNWLCLIFSDSFIFPLIAFTFKNHHLKPLTDAWRWNWQNKAEKIYFYHCFQKIYRPTCMNPYSISHYQRIDWNINFKKAFYPILKNKRKKMTSSYVFLKLTFKYYTLMSLNDVRTSMQLKAVQNIDPLHCVMYTHCLERWIGWCYVFPHLFTQIINKLWWPWRLSLSTLAELSLLGVSVPGKYARAFIANVEFLDGLLPSRFES